jgi:symplekin
MEVDFDELREQEIRSNALNEKFIADAIKSVEVVAHLVISNISRLPDRCPSDFIQNFPTGPTTITTQIDRIAKGFAQQLTEVKLGPGAKELTDQPPKRAKLSAEEEQKIIMGRYKAKEDDETFPKDETTRKLRETLERMKDQPKLKQRVKTLKLQEITKPLHKDLKHQFLLDAVTRVLKCERHAVISGMGFKRKKIMTVFASTFMPSVKKIIMDYIMEDIIKRFDFGLMWLFEEYSLMQGFSRYTYVKSEHKHDYAYNLLIGELSRRLLVRGSEFRERESFVKRLFLEAPIVPEESLKTLESMAENEELYDCGLVLLKDLLIRRPPKEDLFLETLLKFTVHQNQLVRDKAIENVMCVYSLHEILLEKIENFAVKALKLLDKPQPTKEVMKLFTNCSEDLPIPEVWSEDMIKACLQLFLTLMQKNELLIENLCETYIEATSEVKRVILRSIEVPVKNMGVESIELLRIIEMCVKGTETLVTRIIYILTESRKLINVFF